MEKLKFEFVVKASESDNKSNIIALTSIETEKNEVFIMPSEFQNISLHENLKNTPSFQKIKTTLTKRGNMRRVWLSLNDQTLKEYKDDDGNMHFKNYLLEEQIKPNTLQQVQTHESGILAETLQDILNKIATKTNEEKKPETPNLTNLAEKFVIETFTSKNTNVLQWMEIFENECARFKIDQDEKKIEILRLFLEGCCIDWYSSMLIKYTLNSDWKEWKKIFCDTYADKGWTKIRYCFEYKFMSGSLLEYALKKERILLEVNKSIEKQSLIDLIAVGLPNYVCDKIDRKQLKTTEDLFNELRGLEYLTTKKKFFIRKAKIDSEGKSTADALKKPCKKCLENNKSNRYHPEASCWFRNKHPIRTVNNSELEIELNEENPKN